MNNKKIVGGEYSQYCFIQGDFEIVDLDDNNLVVYEGQEKKLYDKGKDNKYYELIKKPIKIKHNNTVSYYFFKELIGRGSFGYVYSIQRINPYRYLQYILNIDKNFDIDQKKINYFNYIEQKFSNDECKQLLEKRKVVKLGENIDDYDIENSDLILKLNHDENIGDNIYNKINTIKKEMIDDLNEEKIDEQERDSIIRSIMDVCGMGIKASNTGKYLIPYYYEQKLYYDEQKLYYSLYLYNGKSLYDSFEEIQRGPIQIEFLIDLFTFMKYFSKRFVHGDIKIENILVNFDENNKIKDFHIIDFDGTKKNNTKDIDNILTTHISITQYDYGNHDKYDYAGLVDVMLYILSKGKYTIMDYKEALFKIKTKIYNILTNTNHIFLIEIKQRIDSIKIKEEFDNSKDNQKLFLYLNAVIWAIFYNKKESTEKKIVISELKNESIKFITNNIFVEEFKFLDQYKQKKEDIFFIIISMLHIFQNTRPSYEYIIKVLENLK